MPGKTAVVVGGGVGGLSSSIRLAKSGREVYLVEKNDRLGGRLQSVHLKAETDHRSFRFDTGPSLLLFPQTYRKEFASLGAQLPPLLEVDRTSLYRVFYEEEDDDNPGEKCSHLDLLADENAMAEQLEGVEMGAGESFHRMMRSARAALEVGVDAFIDRNFETLLDFVNPVRLLPMLPKLVSAGVTNPLSLLQPLDDWLRTYFDDPRIRALFTFQTLYVGLTPYSAPSAFSLLAATELTDGVWYPKGGFGEIGRALETRARQVGVRIETSTTVKRIMVDREDPESSLGVFSQERGRVRGVECLREGETETFAIESDLVLVNADLPYAKQDLLAEGRSKPSDASGSARAGENFSAGIVEFCWGVSSDLDGLAQHNIFLSKDYEDSWIRPGSRRSASYLKRSGNFYVHVPSKTDATSVSAPGTSSCMILFPVANLGEHARGGNYDEMVQWCREVILKRFKEAGLGDIQDKIEVEAVTTPDQWKEVSAILSLFASPLPSLSSLSLSL